MLALLDLEMDFLEQDVMQGRSRTVDALITDPTLPSWGDISMESIYSK